MMKAKFTVALMVFVAFLPQLAAAGDPAQTSFYLIRHAEKELDGGNDPQLTQSGKNRVSMWIDTFNLVVLDAVYSTDTTRTRDTAGPIAEDHELELRLYDPKLLDIDTFIARHRGQGVLVIGHSNTTPAIANKLLGQDRYVELDESNYGSLFIVDIVAGSRYAKLLQINPLNE